MEHFDVIIVGAGLSGVGAACHVRQRHPRKTFAILEGRDAMGGTWDLFAIPASGQTLTCTRSATDSAPGATPRPSLTQNPFSTKSARQPPSSE